MCKWPELNRPAATTALELWIFGELFTKLDILLFRIAGSLSKRWIIVFRTKANAYTAVER